MQGEMQQSWKISVHARANKLHLKLKATKQKSWRLLGFSIFFRLREIFLQVNVKSESGSSIPKQPPKTLKSKFLRCFQKFKTPAAKKRCVAAGKTPNLLHRPVGKVAADRLGKLACQEPMRVASLLAGTISLALVWKLLSEKDRKGFLINCLSIFLFLALLLLLLLKNYTAGKARISLVFSTTAAVVCAAMFEYLDKYTTYDVSEMLWKAWSCAASSGCLYGPISEKRESSQGVVNPWVLIRGTNN